MLFCHLATGAVPASGPFLSLGGVAVPVSPLITNGWTGVSLFFILSGLVLYLPYARGERNMADWHDGIAFYRRRCRRLLPLYFVAAVVVAALAAAIQGVSGSYVADALLLFTLAFTLTPGGFGPPFNIALWSIGVEILFSVLFPVIARTGGRSLARRLGIIVGASLAMRAVGYLIHPAAPGTWLSYQTDNVICRLDDFVLGMMLAKLYVERRLPEHPALLASTGLALVGGAWIGFDLCLHGIWPQVARAALNDLLDAGFAAIIAAALVSRAQLGATLSWAPLQVLGMMCYSLYIWNWPLLVMLVPDRGALPWPSFIAVSLALLMLTFAIAVLSYRFVEFRHVGEWRRLFLLEAPAEPLIPPARLT